MSFISNINQPISKFNNETIVVGTTPVQLPDRPEAGWVQITHEHATAKVYLGDMTDADGVAQTLTVANGWGALALNDTTERYPIINLNKLWLVSDTAGVVVRLLWGE